MPRPRPKNQVHRTENIALTIGEIAPGGDGVALIAHAGDRRAVFVRGAAPGDQLEAQVDFRTRPARGQIARVVAAGPDRVEPPCPHVVRCGGCNWMHLTSDAQTRIHREHLHAALSVRGMAAAWRGPPIEIVQAASPFAYRTRARIHVRASGGRAIVGMHAPQTHDPVEVDACRVLHPDLERARLALPPLFEGTHGTGEVDLALGPEGPAGHRPFVLAIRWSGALPGHAYARFEQAIASAGPDGLRGVRIVCGEAARPSIVGDPTPWMTGADGLPLRLSPGGFAQASEEGNLALARRAAALAERAMQGTEHAQIVELYAGAGNFTVLLAASRHRVTAVESDAGACVAARANLEARDLEAKIVEADASTYAIPKATHLVVLDPPRTGARAVAERLAAQPARFVLYVSCDLGTLGRDLALLAPAYTPRDICAFELFPQTNHLETMILLERQKR